MKLIEHGKAKITPPAPLTAVPREWAPFWPLKRLQHGIDELFEAPLASWTAPDLFGGWGPPVDVFEDKDNVVAKIELPGMKKEEIQLSIVGDILNISGERKRETEHKTAGAYLSERYFGRFHRSVPLPVAVEPAKIQAHYKEGLLTVTCPKTEEAKRKQVDIKVD